MWPDPASGIRERLDELLIEVKRPHWSVTPSFWLLVTSVVISVAALVVAVRGLPQEQKPAAESPQSAQSQSSVAGNSSNSQPQSPRLPTAQTSTAKK